VLAEQCLHRVKVFSAPHTTGPPASRLGMNKKLGGDTAGTADPSGPKGCPIPCDVMLSNKTWWGGEWGCQGGLCWGTG